MSDELAPKIARPALRRQRSPSWVWSIPFILLAGPLNIAGWYLGWPDPENIFLKNTSALGFIVLTPCTVIAIYIQLKIWLTVSFDVYKLMSGAVEGWLIAVFVGPFSYLFIEILSGDLSWLELPKMYITMLIFGTLFGVIPFFAFFIGLPCAVIAFLLAYLCTKPVDQPQNTSLPKRIKPV